jgi:alkylation response protein AidB-like acyl-CoA dehydrogenase
MDFTLSDEQRAFQETARDFARDEWLPYAPGWDEREEFPVEALRRAAALGFAGIYVKDQFGGSGLSRLDAALIFEELATACVSTAAYLSDPQHGGLMIDRFGNEAQRARFLPKLMSMEHFASYCLTEPAAARTRPRFKPWPRRDGDDYA